MADTMAPDVTLSPLQGDERPLSEWLVTFHLLLVAIDPFTRESAALLETAHRVLRTFAEADCRVAWLCTGTAAQTQEFLGPWAQELLTFTDPDRTVVRALDLDSLPALIHIRQDLTTVGRAEGWNPPEWREVLAELAELMSWIPPGIPEPGDPPPFAGSPAGG